MPAYFNLSVQFRRDALYPTFVKDFYTELDKAGMKFFSGYWGYEEDSLEETIEWNQRILTLDLRNTVLMIISRWCISLVVIPRFGDSG